MEWIGYLAGCLTIISFLPQAVKSWQTREVKDLSATSGVLIACASIAWSSYGFALNSYPMIFTNIIVLVIVLSIILVGFYPKQSLRTSKRLHDSH